MSSKVFTPGGSLVVYSRTTLTFIVVRSTFHEAHNYLLLVSVITDHIIIHFTLYIYLLFYFPNIFATIVCGFEFYSGK